MHFGKILALSCLSSGALSFKIRAYNGEDCSGDATEINIYDNTCKGSGVPKTLSFEVLAYGAHRQRAGFYSDGSCNALGREWVDWWADGGSNVFKKDRCINVGFKGFNLDCTSEDPKATRASIVMGSLGDTAHVDLSPQERSYLYFFRQNTSKQLASYFSRAFWDQLVHQFSEAQPAVCHAAISIGASHWHYEVRALGEIHSFPLQQCNKALILLQKNLEHGLSTCTRMETVLTSCFVLVALAFIQGDARAASCHLASGWRLLGQWQDVEETAGFLVAIDWLALQIKSQAVPGTDSKRKGAAVRTWRKLRAWKCQIMESTKTHNDLSRADKMILLHEIWTAVLSIRISTDGRILDGETRYDVCLPHFRRVIQLAEKFLYHAGLDVWMGIVTPLVFCALKCRDWQLRQDVLRLLTIWPFSEGKWSISNTALVISRVIEIESDGLTPHDVIPYA
ncbi:conserved hypothetical protein [Paecilomyces variotii No. 5]|uniref:Fungal-specific transcription factor domain-containing protein n=1 Tax=Byssochlamys spectabilis (strain No. 5 / NBRC 109023) TaxID=1356009 RepID=V5FIS0_BYSSN|nr:conserved hypothetical protein [Paecilomyces variotii No. 5]